MKKYLILSIAFLLFFNFYVTYSKNKEILGYNINLGYHSFDLSYLNKTLQNASFPKLNEYSFLMGIGLNF